MNKYLYTIFLILLATTCLSGCSLLKDVGAVETQVQRLEKVDPVTGETYIEVTTSETLNPDIAVAAERYLPSPWGQILAAVATAGAGVLAAVTRKKSIEKKKVEEAKELAEKTLKVTVKNAEKLPDDAKAEFKKNQKLDTDVAGKALIDNALAS